MPRNATSRAGLLLLLAGLFSPAPLPAQTDSASAVAGPQYEAGPLRQTLLGRSHRELWTSAVRVPVLKPDTLGGLRPTGTGGGLQTVSLVLKGGNGREYRFRPVAKRPGGGLPEDLKNTVVHDVLQDQVSSMNPAGALVAARIVAAAGILHAPPRLYVMPDHPFLGEYRERFAGALGLLEERPEEDEERGITFAGAEEIEGTEDFLKKVEEDPRHRPHAREYLAARLVDVLLGDWDRHADQWRWARYPAGGGRHVWRPIPRDRDYAFIDYDGLVLRAASRVSPQVNRYGERYGATIPGLTLNAEVLDRTLLGPLPRAAWDSVAHALRGRITDPVIDEAVGRLPPEYLRVVGEELRRVLRARRDSLPEAARLFYERIAEVPELRGTDAAETARVERRPDGALTVHLWTGGEPRGEPYLERTFFPAETEEVRLYLHGGDDRAQVEGEGSPILLRVIGGGGDDRFVDRGRGGRTAFYDHRGKNEFVRGAATVVDEREYTGPEPTLEVERNPPRHWGTEFAFFSPYAGWRNFAGVVVGGGPTRTRYGFRRHPWASMQALRALWAPWHGRFGVEYEGRFRRTGTQVVTTLLARATEVEATAFYGFGNATPETLAPAAYVVWTRELRLEPSLTLPVARGAALTLGGELRHARPEPKAGSPAEALSPLGARSFTTAGARAALALERVDDPALPREGFRAWLEGAGYPAVLEAGGGAGGGFARARGVAAGYLSPLAGGPTLALRAGGERVWGSSPIQYAALVGGTETLRGYRRHRFAGDASLFGSAELRQVLTRAELVTRGELGVLALADAGRVWSGGESEGGWHTGVGGGVFFSTLDRTLTLTYAVGDDPEFSVGFALPF